MPAMRPDWLGSPQHLVGGLLLAFIMARAGRRWITEPWLIAVLAVGVTATAELIIELLEYPLLYSDEPHLSAYYDTLADMAATLVGALIGALVAALARRDG
jgi:hypothetical protein